MASNAVVRARINEDLKNEATAVLADMGLTVSDVVRMTLTRVAKDRALPFELKIPNAESRVAMQETRELAKAGRARYSDGQELINGLDQETKEQ